LKYNFLLFFKDYIYEREMVGKQRAKNTQIIKDNRLRSLFCGILEYSNRKIKSRMLLKELTLSHEQWLKTRVIQGLRQNIYNSIKIDKFYQI
jgi:hypothetical protein